MNLIDALSELAYEANRSYLLVAQGVQLPYWSDAGADLKVEAAKTVTALLTSNLSAEQQHSIWVEVRQRAGWKYGAFFDAAEKLDPLLTEYAGLPVEHRVRDEIYRAVDPAAVAAQTDGGPLYSRGNVTSLGGESDSSRLAQANRDIAFQQDKQTWRNPGDPTPGLAVIDNGGPNRNQDFNDGASLRTAMARTTTTRRGTTMDPAAEVIASGIRDRLKSRDQAGVNATNRSIAAASDATSRSNNAATVAASKYGADAQLAGTTLRNSFEMQQKAAERAINAEAWRLSGGDPVKAAALVASTGRDPGNLTSMAAADQSRTASAQSVQSKAVDNTREALQQFGADNKIDPAKSAAAYDAVNKILPGLSNMSEAAREKAMPTAKALADIYGKVADSKQMGLAKVNPFDPRDPARDSMPNFQGGQLVRAGADGLITPGISYGDYYVKGKDGRNVPLGQLSEKQLELINNNIKTGKWN